jgi:hypothetical protein
LREIVPQKEANVGGIWSAFILAVEKSKHVRPIETIRIFDLSVSDAKENISMVSIWQGYPFTVHSNKLEFGSAMPPRPFRASRGGIYVMANLEYHICP